MTSRAQIICTIGPASASSEILRELIAHHMDVARLNFSHGTHEEYAKFIKRIREIAKKTDMNVLIMQDLSGPRMKTQSGHAFDENSESVITEKDKKDLHFGLEHEVDYVALSYVHDASDIVELRELMNKYGLVVPIVAKIERREAVENLEKIIEVSDAIMVARGDLGNEYPLEEIPFVQNKIIKACKKAGKPVFVATQMMLSMTESSVPTRAEVTDVENAISEGADGVMLSEETAIGKYPVEAVAMMEKIVSYTETQTDHAPSTSL